MTTSQSPSQPLPTILRSLLAAAAIAGVYYLVQQTPFAPSPHRADEFVGGYALGGAIAASRC